MARSQMIWPDDVSMDDIARDIAASVPQEAVYAGGEHTVPVPMQATVYGRSARRYAHLAVIDGGRS